MSILCVGTAVYMAVCAMAFGGMLVTRPSAGQAFLDFAKDYGAIFAGIPVLIAVIVAKQQLDASRNTHRLTMLHQTKDRRDALSTARMFLRPFAENTTKELVDIFTGVFEANVDFFRIDDDSRSFYIRNLSPEIYTSLKYVEDTVVKLKGLYDNNRAQFDLSKYGVVDYLRNVATTNLKTVSREERYISDLLG